MDNADLPEIGTIAFTAGGGLLGGTVAALSRPMTRREVFFCLLGSIGIGAFLPEAIRSFYNIPIGVGGAIGFVGGVSVFGVISKLQSATNRWMDKETDRIAPKQP